MRKSYDDFEDYELDESESLRRALREQAREELRFASRRRKKAPAKYRPDLFDYEDDDFGDGFDDADNYEDYDADEFDAYAADWR